MITLINYEEAHIVNGIKMIKKDDIDKALIYASTLARKRAPIRIHRNFDEVPQRFVNCLNPQTYIRPHMHKTLTQWELMCWLSGEIIILFFDEQGKVTNRILINEKNVRVVEIPPLRYHTILAIEKGAYLEVRNCRYNPSIDRVYAGWAPIEENTVLVEAYQKRLYAAKVGDVVIS